MASNIYSQSVSECMSRDLVAAPVGTSAREALALMAENRVAAVPIVDKRNRCVGMLSSTDFVDFTLDLEEDLTEFAEAEEGFRDWMIGKIAESQGHEIVENLMSEKVVTVQQDTKLVEAARLMLQHRVHRLPVVDKSQALKGIVSMSDILKAFVAAAPA